jgi:murein DD-endopeptidase MepM/ murein hydrolase activator NlpD
VTASYGYYDPFGKGTPLLHSGVDLEPQNDPTNAHPEVNVPVHPIGPGKVIAAGGEEKKGYGYHVIIEHRLASGESVYSLYGHLRDSPSVREGDIVSSDTVIGNMGSTGRWSTGTHLHLSIFNTRHLTRRFDLEPYSEKDKEAMDKVFYNPLDVIEGRAKWEFKPVSEWEDHLRSYCERDQGGLQWQPVFA